MNLLQELILFKYQTYFEVYHILHILQGIYAYPLPHIQSFGFLC